MSAKTNAKTNANTNAKGDKMSDNTNTNNDIIETTINRIHDSIVSGAALERPKSYTFANLGDGMTALAAMGASAFHRATLPVITAALDGLDEAVVSATVNYKDTKRGARVEVVFVTVNYGTIHVTTNTTAALDPRKVIRSYLNKCANRRAKDAERNTPENIAKRENAKATAKVRRETRTYYRNLIKHGMTPDDAKVYALMYANEQGNNDATIVDDLMAA